MARINTKELVPGMALAEDVIGSNGRLLMVKGTVLEDKHLRILNVWGVSEVEIAASPGGDTPAREARADPETLAACEASVKARFGKTDLGGEFASELLRLTVESCAARIVAGEPMPAPVTLPRPAKIADKPPSLKILLIRGGKVVACPDIYLRITEAIRNPNCSVTHLADIVGKDIAVSAKLLKLVNSPVYGYSMKVDSLMRGITILGFKELSQVVLGLSVFNQFMGIRSDLLSVRDFLKHGLSCGIIARILASNRPDLPEERFFIAGLLHDIGRMPLLTVSPGVLATAMAKAGEGGQPLFEVETELFGFNHADVGGALLSQWKLPPEIEDPIRHHHDPEKAADPVGASLVCVADCLATAMNVGFSGNLHPIVDGAAWERLGLPLGVVESTLSQAQRQVDESLRTFLE